VAPRSDGYIDLMIRVLNFRDTTGRCRLWVHTAASTFPYGAGYSVADYPINNATNTLNVTMLVPPGDVAVFALHDEDLDGQLGTNFIGMPIEGCCATRGARGGMSGGPYWDDARVAVGSTPCTAVDLDMWYMF